jgi:hypothetical protein
MNCWGVTKGTMVCEKPHSLSALYIFFEALGKVLSKAQELVLVIPLPQGRFRPLCQGPGIGCRFSSGSKSQYNRVVCKVKTNTAPESPWVWSYTEFGHTHGEIQEKPATKYISIQWGETQKTIKSSGELSFIHPVFPFSWAPPLSLRIFSLLLFVQLL